MRTQDAGVTWKSLPAPCSSEVWLGAEMASYGASVVWIVCQGEPATIMSAKEVWTSADAGNTWRLVSQTSMASPSSDVGNVPSGGHVADLFLSGPDHGWLALARSTLMESVDGGRSWSAANGIDDVDGASQVMFTDLKTGWAIAAGMLGASVYQTVDAGQHWREREIIADGAAPGAR